MSIRDIHRLYKNETGNGKQDEWSFYLTRWKGNWVLDISDQEKMELFGKWGVFTIPDLDYIEWLERKLSEYI